MKRHIFMPALFTVIIMSVFDDIAKSMSEAAAYTAKKTSEITGLAKMKMSIHAEEEKLNKCYQELGMLYYEYQRNNTDNVSDIAALIAEADVIRASLTVMYDDLAALRNLSICKNCSAKIDSSSVFCPNCGHKLGDSEEKSE